MQGAGCRPVETHQRSPGKVSYRQRYERHEQPVVISNFSAEGCLPMYLPTSSCYSGYSD